MAVGSPEDPWGALFLGLCGFPWPENGASLHGSLPGELVHCSGQSPRGKIYGGAILGLCGFPLARRPQNYVPSMDLWAGSFPK